MENNTVSTPTIIITPEEMLQHWQGHRGLTRKVIEAFPEDQLFTFSIGGMRTFSAMVHELVDIAAGGVRGIATGEWKTLMHGEEDAFPKDKAGVLKLWDQVTEIIEEYWPQIKPGRFHEVDKAFGQYENTVYASLLYFIDNEIHHRGEGYVYLRALGIQPPFFWER